MNYIDLFLSKFKMQKQEVKKQEVYYLLPVFKMQNL